MLRKIAASHAFHLLSKLIDLGIVPDGEPVTASAKCDVHKVQIIVTIASFEPATISAETLARIESMKNPTKPRLTPQKKKILELLTGQPPRKATWIAIRLGKRNADGHLRAALAELVADGVLVKGAQFGYQLLPCPGQTPLAAG